MKKISVLLLVLFAWIGVKAQNPVVVTQPYKFQKYVNALSALYIPVYSNNTFSGYPVTNGALGFALADSSTYQYFNGIWHKLGSGSSVTSVLGTTNRITSTGGTTPQIDISSTFEALLEKVANKTATASTSTTTYPNWLGVENYVTSVVGGPYLPLTLSSNTTVTAAGNDLFFSGLNSGYQWSIEGHSNGSSSTLFLNAFDKTGGLGHWLSSSLSLQNDQGNFSYINQTSGLTSQLTVKNTGIFVQDALGGHGITNATNTYTPTDSTLITKHMGDGLYAPISGGGGITALTGDVTASGSGSVVATIKTSVSLAGSPTTTTQTTSDNSTKIATTAFVQANFTATAISFAPGTFTGAGTSGSPFALGIDTSPTSGSGLPVTSGGVFTALGLKAPLASPALTGTPTAPTATVGTNTTQIATTAFVLANSGGLSASNFVFNEIPSGTINGSNVTFTLANTPTTGKVTLYKNGQLLAPTTDYTISGSTITYVIAPTTVGGTDVLLANYMK